MFTRKSSFRRIVSFLLVLSMCLSMAPMAYATEEATQPAEEIVVQTESTVEEAPATTETTEATEETHSLCTHEREGDCPICAVEGMIEALPTAEQWLAMDLEEQNEAYTAAQLAADAFNALSAEEQGQVSNFPVLQTLHMVINQSIATITGYTSQEALAWVRSQNGKAIDFDGVYGAQCVDLIKAYYYMLEGFMTYGNGCDYAYNALPSGWIRIKDGNPQPGDILVYSGAGEYGHVAIYESDYSTWHQNAPNQWVTNWSKTYYRNITAGDGSPYWGCIRPNFKDNSNDSDVETIVTFNFPTEEKYASKYWIGETNAVLVSQVSISQGTFQNATKAGLILYNEAGSEVDSVTEVPSDSFKRFSSSHMWYDINAELGYTLESGTTYHYCFFVEVNGKFYFSDRYSFTTAFSYADYGDDFYAYIIQTEGWKHLEARDNNVQLALNGNSLKDPKQIWHFVKNSNGSYKVYNEFNGSLMDVYNSETSNGTNILTWHEDHGSNNQCWYLIESGNSGVVASALNTAKVLDIRDGSTTGGTNVCLWDRSDSAGQLLSVYYVSNDGITYSKPARPDKPVLTATTNSGSVSFRWTDSPLKSERYDTRSYDLRIWKGTDTSANVIHFESIDSTSRANLSLEPGTYTANITAVNSKYCEWFTTSDTVTFEVSGSHQHTFGQWVQTEAPGCETFGSEERSCTTCGDTEIRQIDPLGHDYKAAVTEPTCSEKGYATYTCARCKDSYKDNYTEATGKHTYGSWTQTKAAKCMEKGSEKRNCSVCKVEDTREIPALGHDPEIRGAVKATATKPGYTGDKVCKRCDLLLEKGKEIPATGEETPAATPVYRVYNPYTTETLYVNEDEYGPLVAAGWIDQGVAWYAPAEPTKVLVYRVYNTYDDYHIYIQDQAEIDGLAVGWQVDGIASSCAGKENGVPIWRLFNPNSAPRTCYHYYTTKQSEIDEKVSQGWKLEGIAWYAAK